MASNKVLLTNCTDAVGRTRRVTVRRSAAATISFTVPPGESFSLSLAETLSLIATLRSLVGDRP